MPDEEANGEPVEEEYNDEYWTHREYQKLYNRSMPFNTRPPRVHYAIICQIMLWLRRPAAYSLLLLLVMVCL